MPFINSVTTIKIDDEKREKLKKELGQIICEIPGKTEKWLMLNFDDGNNMYFHGDASLDTAFVEVKIFGSATEDEYERLTARICELYNRVLSIPSDRIYVRYEESYHWGWNGSNF